MEKKIFIIVLVHLALAAQGLEERKITGKEQKQVYYRFTSDKMNEDEYVDIKEEKAKDIVPVLQANGFDPSAKTVIVIHGFTSSAPNVWKKFKFAKAYRAAKKRVNLIIVDWSNTTRLPFYGHAVESIDEIGGRICRHLIRALKKAKAELSNLHFIGHSLGAYVAAYVGVCSKGRVGMITALDPADPLFTGIASNPNSKFLTTEAAKFVEVIHTNGGDLSQGCLGRTEPLGHVDFYVNTKRENKKLFGSFRFDKQHQTGCNDPTFRDFLDLSNNYVEDLGCSHTRAWYYYVESIFYQKVFEARQCTEWKKIKGGFLGLRHVANECIKAGSVDLYLGDNLDTAKALKIKGDTVFFLTTTDGKNGNYSKDKFEL